MAYYDRRDLIGHWIRRSQPTQHMCTHPCCRGKRVHPDNYPVILPSKLLRMASDDDLAYHYGRAPDTPAGDRARAQVLWEAERRDRAEAERRQRRESVFAARAARTAEQEADTERIFLQAEAEMRGNWLNRAGRAAGISERQILTGPASTFRRYASDEAREYFAANPRPTGAYFRGRDTRIHAHYTDRDVRAMARPRRARGARPAQRKVTTWLWGKD